MLVSVLLITYNQERYIEQAIESVLAQKVDFDYEIVIGDDHSTDRTSEIAGAYAAKHPHIRHERRTKNLGAPGNYVETSNSCRGKYIAWLAGDDYWCDGDKLQEQADMLESDPTLAISFTQAHYLDEDTGEVRQTLPQGVLARTALKDLLAHNYIPATTVMYRREPIEPLPEWMRDLKAQDYASHLLSALHGDIGFIQKPMTMYRVHGAGVWSKEGRLRQIPHEIAVYERLKGHVPEDALPVLDYSKRALHFDLARQLLRKDELAEARKHIQLAMDPVPGSAPIPARRLLRVAARLGIPGYNRLANRLSRNR
jgi:hypothetical protein